MLLIPLWLGKGLQNHWYRDTINHCNAIQGDVMYLFGLNCKGDATFTRLKYIQSSFFLDTIIGSTATVVSYIIKNHNKNKGRLLSSVLFHYSNYRTSAILLNEQIHPADEPSSEVYIVSFHSLHDNHRQK